MTAEILLLSITQRFLPYPIGLCIKVSIVVQYVGVKRVIWFKILAELASRTKFVTDFEGSSVNKYHFALYSFGEKNDSTN